MSWGWGWYPKPKPRRPAKGIRAKTTRGQFGQTWWAGLWIEALERLVDPGRLSRGRSYARSGQVLNLDIKLGRVDSRVQGSRPTPYKVRIEIKPLAEKAWDKVVDAMAAQAIFAAKLLAGEMPHNIEEAFSTAKVSLFPAKRGDLVTECSCPDWANPCKHIAAVYYLLGEQFDEDPFLIFQLRGRIKAQIIAALRAARAADEGEPATTRKRAGRKAQPAEKLGRWPSAWRPSGQRAMNWKRCALPLPRRPWRPRLSSAWVSQLSGRVTRACCHRWRRPIALSPRPPWR